VIHNIPITYERLMPARGNRLRACDVRARQLDVHLGIPHVRTFTRLSEPAVPLHGMEL